MKRYKKSQNLPGSRRKAVPKFPRCAECVQAEDMIAGRASESWMKSISWAWDHIQNCRTPYAATARKKLRSASSTVPLK